MTDASNANGRCVRTTVIVVTYNSAGDIRRCLASIAAAGLGDAELIVVDNASADATAKIVEREFAWARLLRHAVNAGYFGGVATALPQARGDYVCVMNADTVVEPGWLSESVACLDAHPEAGAAGSLITLLGEPGLINAAGLSIHVAGVGFVRELRQPVEAVGQAPFVVAGVSGCAFLVRRELLAACLPLLDDLFLYYEDVALSLLLQLMGWRLYCVPASRVRHDYALHMSARKTYLVERNRLETQAFALQASSWLRYAPLLLANEALALAYCAAKGPAYVAAKLSAYGAVWRRRGVIAAKRRRFRDLRVVPDRDVLSRLTKTYPLPQIGRILRPTRRERLSALPAHGEVSA